jgi:hypothetical protein
MSTFDPVPLPPMKEAFDMSKNIRISNIKQGKSNIQVETVKLALSKLWPAFVPPGDEYDFNMTQGVLRLQEQLGTPVTGIITREELKALAELTDVEFNVA